VDYFVIKADEQTKVVRLSRGFAGCYADLTARTPVSAYAYRTQKGLDGRSAGSYDQQRNGLGTASDKDFCAAMF